MHTQTLIIGGGLSGLSLAYRLQQADHDYHLLDARRRLGGRIKSLIVGDVAVDLGPSWIWPGQERIAALLPELGLHAFEQHAQGTQLYEQASGEVMQNAGFMSMAGALRIGGGTSALTDALAARLDPSRMTMNAQAAHISDAPSATLADGRTITADRIVLALPPRVAADLTYAPVLPQIATLKSIPTWMGAHAKFVAVYGTPFWRDAGLSGDASSRRGPMVEIHDASPEDGTFGALFGFVGLPAHVRAQVGDQVQHAALTQLTNIFGAAASKPLTSHLEDWSAAAFTSTAADATPPTGHPPYQMPAPLSRVWNDKLIFTSTEMAPDNGGLIEGALAAAEHTARKIL
ncbi:flavin monoamine oxidase family protein [Loktanella sp. Alg231-35]|uniref:flavin monoamine oxidase family protein n=1 Tax=Loktanella sp. Alg231-35 TaxID=1922220 RepID=UPI000D55E9FA|nr:FAD-dependent oxidoreductase [Loktanella sp. Alg231-35]